MCCKGFFVILVFSMRFSVTRQLASYHPNDHHKLMDAEPMDLMT